MNVTAPQGRSQELFLGGAAGDFGGANGNFGGEMPLCYSFSCCFFGVAKILGGGANAPLATGLPHPTNKRPTFLDPI